jgi:hypothetical protein
MQGLLLAYIIVNLLVCCFQGLSRSDWPADSKPTDAELTVWTEHRLQCLSELCEWSKMADCVTSAIDTRTPVNLDRIWDDTSKQVGVAMTTGSVNKD